MSIPLLATKFSIPPLRRKLVLRPRLIAQLTQGLERKLILISAPAGYGKTTLVSAWLNQCSEPAAWISFDEGDNDLARFLTYLAAGLQSIHAEIGRTMLALLQSPQLMAVQSLLTTLINDIAQFQDHFVLVLDDYHQIQEASIHQALGYLLDHLPEHMHLVISTRADPPLPLARLRAQSQILELRATDLCFTQPEAEKFLAQSMGLEISRDEAGTLAARTEGWIAGLQLAAVSIQGREDPSHFIQNFAGSNRHVFDYLLEEVLQRQPEPVQTFLLKTSILSHLNGSLCGAVTGQEDSQAMLERLDRANLFVISLDDQRCWYRYHHLFSDLLHQRLLLKHADLVPVMHLRASEWYEAQGLPVEAIRHALSSGDYDGSARLIEKTADSTLMHGELKTFLSWVERLPEPAASRRPLLSVYHAVALLLSGRAIDAAARRLAGTPEHDAIQALIASYRGDVKLSQRLCERVLENLPEESLFLRGVITSTLGAVLLMGGEVEPAIQTFRASKEIGRLNGNLMLEIIALSRLGQLHHLSGKLRTAEAFYHDALDKCVDRQGSYLPVASMPLMAYAFLAREWNDLKLALSLIQKSVELCDVSGGFWSVDCFVVYALVLQAMGDAEGALVAMQKARKIAASTEANRFDDIYTAAYEARLFVAQGKLDSAAQWARLNNLDQPQEAGNAAAESRLSPQLYHLVEIEQTTLARVFITLGKLDEALAILASLLPESEKRGRKAAIIENLVLQARAYLAKGMTADALKALQSALSRTGSEDFIRVFVDEGQPVEQLLKMAGRHPLARETIHKLLTLFGTAISTPHSQPPPHQLIEPLSEREVEILRLIAAGLSNHEIAGRLVISLSTVKGHTANIFGKLDVKNRTQAVARGRDLELIQ